MPCLSLAPDQAHQDWEGPRAGRAQGGMTCIINTVLSVASGPAGTQLQELCESRAWCFTSVTIQCGIVLPGYGGGDCMVQKHQLRRIASTSAVMMRILWTNWRSSTKGAQCTSLEVRGMSWEKGEGGTAGV